MDALLTDALGTLVRLEPPAAALRREFAQRFALELTEAQAEAALREEISYYRAHLDEGRDAGTLAALRARCTEALRAALPRTRELAQLEPQALQDALLAALRFSAFEDAPPALSALRALGVRTVVLSNWDISLHDVLAGVGLSPLLDAVLTSAEAGVRKPARQIFELALELAGVAAGGAVHVGDSLGEDIAGARSAGIEAILISRDGAPGPPGVRTITTLRELLGGA